MTKNENPPLPQTCKDCKYLGSVALPFIGGFGGRTEWRACLYPLPNHISPHSKSIATYHECRVKEIKE